VHGKSHYILEALFCGDVNLQAQISFAIKVCIKGNALL
jgi:hypothetical protein